MFSKCKKKCKCEDCEYAYEENVVMRIKDEQFSTMFNTHYRSVYGVSCNNGYRVALDQDDLKSGYEEDDYYIENNIIYKRGE